MPTAGSEDLITPLLDKVAITDLIHRYARSMDRNDAALGYSVWHPGSVVDYGPVYQGSGPGFIDFAVESHQPLIAHQHLVGNIIIDLNGAEAGSESCFHANFQLANEDGMRHLAVWGRYLDRWSKRDGRWGIDKRVAITDFQEMREVHTSPGAGPRPYGRAKQERSILSRAAQLSPARGLDEPQPAISAP